MTPSITQSQYVRTKLDMPLPSGMVLAINLDTNVNPKEDVEFIMRVWQIACEELNVEGGAA